MEEKRKEKDIMTILTIIAILVGVVIFWPILKRLMSIGIKATNTKLDELETRIDKKDKN